jgi:hypothetical protein
MWTATAGDRDTPCVEEAELDLAVGLVGDQLYVDLDVSAASLPAGSRIALGDHAVIEVTDQPHTGCAKFAARFGRDAHKMVWSDEGKRLRGRNAKVVVPGTIRPATPSACCRPTDVIARRQDPMGRVPAAQNTGA